MRAGSVPSEVLGIAELAWLDEVAKRQQDTEEDADTSDDNVGDAKERVASSDERDCTEHNRLSAAEWLDGVVCEQERGKAPSARARYRSQHIGDQFTHS